jgi:hypothetical protein
MAKRQIFYSFHFDNDVMRVQQIRNIGVIEGNAPVSANDWEEVKRQGDAAIEKWIDDNMRYRSCVVVLVGSSTANRKWVQREIQKAWAAGKGIVGIHIHNVNCPRNGKCTKGSNPFEQFTIGGKSMSSIVKCYDPSPWDAYNNIAANIESWIEEAINIRNRY